ncbi:hypothetical protein M422DRAFT_268442 [Sphaerobolus stellatus SS14]|uniref:BTB domain-containing protein n=1 Tax=Sphaerobolus stellatus (strain SS14) TaxID=990650 RepID=A0A0C9UY92_SPHS4|nr:hypothetical protein M422DRAFT_268442 [Sphaerobolus stellatus SS14]
MSNLHVYFLQRNEQAFAKALEAARNSNQASNTGQLSTSAGRRGGIATAVVNVNARDWLGRTVLHPAVAITEAYALNYLGMLLAHPGINVNMQDIESKWTPLHRALYVGNVAACRLLLRCPDIDVQLRDNEVEAAADFYPLKLPNTSADLFTWGGSRNAALGHGNSKGRSYLDMVTLEKTAKPGDPDKFIPIQIKGASMAKLHTKVPTSEYVALEALRTFPSHPIQLPPLHIPSLFQITSIAPAQDHTLALSSRGEVYSWGLNRFSQPGCVVEPATSGVSGALGGFGFGKDEPFQAIPRKVVGPLKKAVVVGVAACKTASACWTDKELFTWGTNNGQLGYDSAAQAVQVLPRKVTGVQEVLMIALTDTAMACLVPTSDNSLINEVICFRDDSRFRVKFTLPDFNSLPRYTSPGARRPSIIKTTACEGTFAAFSSYGDVWTFSVQGRPARTDGDKERMKEREKEEGAGKAGREAREGDVALGSDGDLIVCIDSGHAFVRSRSSTSSNTTTSSSHSIRKSNTSSSNLTALTPSHLAPSANTKGKFTRVPFIHRVIRVCANAAGAFGAVRLNYVPKVVKVEGNNLGRDLATIRPWARGEEEEMGGKERLSTYSARGYIKLLEEDKKTRKDGKSGVFGVDLQDWGLDGKVKMKLHGADMLVRAGMLIPVHRVVLAMKSGVLRGFMDGGGVTLSRQAGSTASSSKSSSRSKSSSANASLPKLTISGIQSLAVFLFLHFLYAEEVPVLDTLSFTGARAVRKDVGTLANAVGMGERLSVGASGARVVESGVIGSGRDIDIAILKPDAYLELADRRLPAHSVVLRSRCLFYKRFFDSDVWTRERWSDEGVVGVDMRYLEWRVVRFVFEWVYRGEAAELFTRLDEIENVGELIDLITDVTAAGVLRIRMSAPPSPDIDVYPRDNEGLTPLDLPLAVPADLFIWRHCRRSTKKGGALLDSTLRSGGSVQVDGMDKLWPFRVGFDVDLISGSSKGGEWAMEADMCALDSTERSESVMGTSSAHVWWSKVFGSLTYTVETTDERIVFLEDKYLVKAFRTLPVAGPSSTSEKETQTEGLW